MNLALLSFLPTSIPSKNKEECILNVGIRIGYSTMKGSCSSSSSCIGIVTLPTGENLYNKVTFNLYSRVACNFR